jgi:hypothetical protein
VKGGWFTSESTKMRIEPKRNNIGAQNIFRRDKPRPDKVEAIKVLQPPLNVSQL